MKPLCSLMVLVISLPSLAAFNASEMTCEQARKVVIRNGVVNMAVNEQSYRIVNDESFCFPDEHLEIVWAKTLDFKRCAVGKVCQSK